MYLLGEVGSLVGTVAQAHSGKHIALGGDAYTCTATKGALVHNLLPQLALSSLNLLALGVALYLLHDGLNLLNLKVDDIVHDALSYSYVLLEEVEVEVCLGGEGVYYV